MNHTFSRSLLAVALASAIGFSGASFAKELKTEKDKASYMVGMQIGSSLKSIKDEVDLKTVFDAITTTVNGGKTALTPEQAAEVSKAFGEKMRTKSEAKAKAQGAKNKAEGEKFLAANKGKAGVKSTASGLQYKANTEGKGPKPKASDTVKVHYTGTLLDGTKFDSSVDRGQPATFPLSGVIAGWTEGLQLMPVGSKYTFWIPSNLAYGERGTPGPIGPNSTLKFDVELIEIVKKEEKK